MRAGPFIAVPDLRIAALRAPLGAIAAAVDAAARARAEPVPAAMAARPRTQAGAARHRPDRGAAPDVGIVGVAALTGQNRGRAVAIKRGCCQPAGLAA
jgi:hypothetical protein